MDAEQNVEQTNVNPQTQEEVKQETLDAVIAEYSEMTREELVGELQKLISAEDMEMLRMRVPLLKNAFQALPKPEPVAVKESQQNTEESQQSTQDEQQAEQPKPEPAPVEDETEKQFYGLYNIYKEKRQQYLLEQEQIKQQNLEKKKSLLEELKQLLDSEKTLKEIYDDFNAIQEKWKSVGNVPHTEVNHLWENYHFLIEKFYEKVKINRELRDLDLKRNLEEKLIICEKAEELLVSEDINNSFQILQEYHRQWKEIGPVPSDKKDEIWERFKKASDAINARRLEYYEKRSEELETNLKIKQELVDMASEVNSHSRNNMSDWNKDAEMMDKLVEKWKTIGPVPRQYNDEIWNKFKAQKDGFFEARKEMFTHSRQVEEENYSKKLNICERAEAIAKRTDFDKATKELLALQEEWKNIGFVRKSMSETIWLRFRAACDEFFKNKSEDYMRTHKEAEDNIKAKEALIEELKAQEFTEDKVKNVDILKNFQKRWFEIGFTPKLERLRLQKQWEEIISANKEKLQISAAEIAQKGSGFLAKVSSMADNGRDAVNARIRVLEKQIDSVENNLGFLSGSKNADILKKEFENKINKLKNERNMLLQHLKELANEKINNNENKTQQPATEENKQSEETSKEENN